MGQGVQIGVIKRRDVAERVSFDPKPLREGGPTLRPRAQSPCVAEEHGFGFASAAAEAESSQVVEIMIRLLDIIGSMAILALAFPVMFVVALLIKLTSHGPILYKQDRVGRGGKIFKLYKFRTMIKDAEKHIGPVWATKNDGGVTPVGRVLRRTRLDELPQVYNVLRGDMSLVGPRPERPYFVARHTALQGVRLSVKPGLTGLAQVRSLYDLKPAHKMKYDHLYIQKRSLLLNIYILLQTIPVLFARKGW
jgi:lipopolysaccharide/colanic/teichoic acid biosynthesis glycosyltransferase